MTIIVVTGSRSLANSPARVAIKENFISTIGNLVPTQVNHGGARGPDSWASQHFPDQQKVHRPEPTSNRWDAIDALFQRNLDMIDYANDVAYTMGERAIIVACWDGKSRGTEHAFKFAQTLKMPVVFIPVQLIEELERRNGQ